MLLSVLNSEQAIEVNITIMRASDLEKVAQMLSELVEIELALWSHDTI